MDLLVELLSDSKSTSATGLNDQITKIDAQHIAGGSFVDVQWAAIYRNGRETVKIMRCILVNRCVLQASLHLILPLTVYLSYASILVCTQESPDVVQSQAETC